MIFQKRKLSKIYNDNMAGIVNGLIALTEVPGSKLQFNLVAGKKPFAAQGQVLITTNICAQNLFGQYNKSGDLAIIVSGHGISAYGYEGGEAMNLSLFKNPEQILADGKDAATVKEVLSAVEQEARKQGLLPKP